MPPSIVHWTSPEYDYVVTRAARNNVLQTKAEGCDSVKMKRRNYDSGCAKRKQKAEKKRIADTLPKLTSFFTPAAATAAAAELATGSAVGENDEVEVEVEEEGGEVGAEEEEVAMEAEGEEDEDEDDLAVSSAMPFTTSSSGNSFLIGDDPAHWPEKLTDSERCSIVQKGPVQLRGDFPQNTQGRRFTSTHYYLNMKNGEKIQRSRPPVCPGCHLY